MRREGIWAKGLSVAQNLSYLAGYLFYLHTIPRLIFFVAPIVFLVLDLHAIHAPAIAVQAIPYLFIMQTATWTIYGRSRHPLWGDVYETITSWYLLRPTLTALHNPKAGMFNVTPKGGHMDDGFFDHGIARPFIVMLTLSWAAMATGAWRIVYGDPTWTGAVAINMLWNLYNLLVLSVCLAACWERPQRRLSPRVVQHNLPVTLVVGNTALRARTEDASLTGLRVTLEDEIEPGRITQGQEITVHLDPPDSGLEYDLASTEPHPLLARVITAHEGTVSLKFNPPGLERERWLNQNLFGRPDAWKHLEYERGSFLSSIGKFVQITLRFYYNVLGRYSKRVATKGWAQESEN